MLKSQTRATIIRQFMSHPDISFYLQQLARKFRLSAGNIRRELLNLKAAGFLETEWSGKILYYKVNNRSPFFQFMKSQLKANTQTDNEKIALKWVSLADPIPLEAADYCETRDVLSARLESVFNKLEKTVGQDAYLLAAAIGEIGNNSFDHNLGNWPDIPGIFLSVDNISRKTVLADRGQGILQTLNRVYPRLKDHREALKIAFTRRISGRFPEKRGNGLKFVSKVIKDYKWTLNFQSGNAQLILKDGKMALKNSPSIYGCLAVINY